MKQATLVIFSLVLLFSSATATGFFGGPPEPGKIPTRFVKFEALAVGLQFARTDQMNGLGGLTARVARVTYVGGRFRVGAALFDVIPSGPGATPEFHVGIDLLSRPKKTWRVYSAVPDLYVEAACGIPTGYFYGKLLAGCDVDYYGVGASFEMGVAVWRSIEGRYWVADPSFFAGFRLRLLTFGIGV